MYITVVDKWSFLKISYLSLCSWYVKKHINPKPPTLVWSLNRYTSLALWSTKMLLQGMGEKNRFCERRQLGAFALGFLVLTSCVCVIRSRDPLNSLRSEFLALNVPMATKCWSTMTKKTEDEKVVVCHKSASDGGAWRTLICFHSSVEEYYIHL
jgi:hypothetical protein